MTTECPKGGEHYWDYAVETKQPLKPGEVARICTQCYRFEVLSAHVERT